MHTQLHDGFRKPLTSVHLGLRISSAWDKCCASMRHLLFPTFFFLAVCVRGQGLLVLTVHSVGFRDRKPTHSTEIWSKCTWMHATQEKNMKSLNFVQLISNLICSHALLWYWFYFFRKYVKAEIYLVTFSNLVCIFFRTLNGTLVGYFTEQSLRIQAVCLLWELDHL